LSRVHSHVPARPSRPRQAQQQAQTKDASRSRTQSPKPHGPAAKTPATPQASAPQAAAPQPAKADAAPAAPPPAPVAPQAEEPPALAPRADQGKEDAAVEPPEGPSDHAAEPAPESPASDTGRLLTDLIDPTYPDDIGPEGLKAQEAQADAAAGAARLAVPDKQSRQQAHEKIRDLFQREFAGAQTPQQKLTLAATLLDEMQKTPDDPTARFVLLQLACETAAAAGELPKTLEIVDRMRRDYDIDALKVKAYVLSKLIASLPAGPRSTVAGQQLLSALEQLADESLAEDNLAMANRFVELGVAAAGKAADDSLRQRAAMRQRQVQGLTARFALVKDALNRLAEDADDGNANLIAGRWYCFSVGDFSKGLPLLAKCADPVAAAMAKRDLACPEDCRKQVELADLWWELAAKQPELTKSRMQSRARFWYNQALPKLEGSEKIRVSQRLEGIAAAPAGPRSP
jgi:hypothetical protein